MSDRPLEGVRILVTRPAAQAENLCRLIEGAGGIALRLPALDIAPPSDPAALAAAGDRLGEYDLAIFVSANAVRGLLAHLTRPMPPALKLAAIGPATARALADAGYPDVLCPSSGFDSESLLALPELQRAGNSRVVIFRGDSGRGLLGSVLRERGAQVEYVESYRREAPPPPEPAVREALRRRQLDAAVVTSGEALERLLELCSDDMLEGLTGAQLVVVSERMIQLAQSLGFRDPLIAAAPGDRAIFEALVAWRTGQPPQETASPT